MNKMIHSDEFRLRILLTNACNKNCNFCLNDFQDKEPEQHANPLDVADCIRAYGQFMKSIKEKSIVTFSGGEPGIYPQLELVLPYAKAYCDEVKVVTNGTALKERYYQFVDKWHVGVTDRDSKVLEIPDDKLVVQIVVTKDTDKDNLKNLVGFYRYYKSSSIKLFADFHEENRDEIYKKIDYVSESYAISTRWTGIQINRGKVCDGCEKDCVTLKALWYFPDGTSSTCPQGEREFYFDNSWDETVEKAYEAHKIK